MSSTIKTARTKVKRLPERGVYDPQVLYRILDEGFVCHVGFIMDSQPFVIPTGYGRVGETLYLHGSTASRMFKSLARGVPVCVTVTHVDGIVVARSAFNSSMNYRSVVILGTATPVIDPDEKLAALRAIAEHIIPHRWADFRPPKAKEIKGTSVLSLPIREASAKVRTGPPHDDKADYALPIWGGVIPLRTTVDPPIPDSEAAGMAVPPNIAHYSRARKSS